MCWCAVACVHTQVRYFQRLPENLRKLKAVAARMAKSGLVSPPAAYDKVCVMSCDKQGLGGQAKDAGTLKDSLVLSHEA